MNNERIFQSNQSPLLVLEDVKIHYSMKQSIFTKPTIIKAVDGVSLQINRGKTLGLVGESGSGKSTLGRGIIGLEALTSGRISFEGKPLDFSKNRKQLSREIQIVFQDPYSSLNPKKTIGDLLREPLLFHQIVPKKEVEQEVDRLLELVGLNTQMKKRFPHEFSGGQRQRIGIARALSVRPKLLICDEPVSALDVSIQAQILNLFKQLQQELNLTYLFIAHGLGTVRYISDDIAVMYKGELVEYGSKEEVFERPQHEYTKNLLAAYPVANPHNKQW